MADKIVRIGVIGLGNMGTGHARYLSEGKVPRGVLTAVCDIMPDKIARAKSWLGDSVLYFDSVDAMLNANVVDGIMIETPHYDHPPIAIKGFERGLHVLSDKPAGVYTKQVRQMNEAAVKSGKVFSIMFQARSSPAVCKMKELIEAGELGDLKRVVRVVTGHYRSQSYYDSGDWRATWGGEGGGVLMNQDPHALDVLQWVTGMPKTVHAFLSYGKYHNIEVEDDATAYMEYENGATGVYITSTGEAPGAERFEVSGNNGRLAIEGGKLIFYRLRLSERKFNAEYRGGFGDPECWKCEIPTDTRKDTGHATITTNWVNAILDGAPLIAPGVEGINGLMIANAMYLSSWTNSTVNIPIDEDLFYEKLQEKIKNSTYVKPTQGSIVLDIEKSFR